MMNNDLAIPEPCPSVQPAAEAGQRRTAARPRGFTLIELMVVLAVMTFIGLGMTTSFKSTVAGYRILNEANSLSRDFQFARAEALKRGGFVAVCASANGSTCSGTTSWTAGWLVFYNGAGNYTGSGAYTLASTDTLLRAETQTAGKNTFVADNSVTSVIFNRQGSVSLLPANPVTLTLHDPTSSATLTRCVTVVPSGRTQVQNAGVGNCT